MQNTRDLFLWVAILVVLVLFDCLLYLCYKTMLLFLLDIRQSRYLRLVRLLYYTVLILQVILINFEVVDLKIRNDLRLALNLLMFVIIESVLLVVSS